jgi:hypothetical protein
MEKDIFLDWLIHTFESFSDDGYCAGWMEGLELSMFDLAVQGGGAYGQTVMSRKTADQILYVARHVGKWVVFDREIVDLSMFLEDNNRVMPESLSVATKSVVISDDVSVAIEETNHALTEILVSGFDEVSSQFMVDFFEACELRNLEIPKSHREGVLVKVAQTLGERFTESCYSYKIVQIPSDVEYGISEDGSEWIAEKHRVWS